MQTSSSLSDNEILESITVYLSNLRKSKEEENKYSNLQFKVA